MKSNRPPKVSVRLDTRNAVYTRLAIQCGAPMQKIIGANPKHILIVPDKLPAPENGCLSDFNWWRQTYRGVTFGLCLGQNGYEVGEPDFIVVGSSNATVDFLLEVAKIGSHDFVCLGAEAFKVVFGHGRLAGTKAALYCTTLYPSQYKPCRVFTMPDLPATQPDTKNDWKVRREMMMLETLLRGRARLALLQYLKDQK